MTNLRRAAFRIAARLNEAGYECYYAGGCVRDRLLGGEPHDIDIVTSAQPDVVMSLFPGNATGVGAHFGVVLVRMDGMSFDVATFREDGQYRDGRHPEGVTFSDARHDALRRDFTVNGLFEDPFSGDVIDFVNGLPDLEKRLIRTIGLPEDRFGEDALRLMRGVRFAVTKGFGIETLTYEAIARLHHLLRSISVERIREEFDRILLCKNRRRGVEMLVDTGLMDEIIPEIRPMIGCEQPPQYHPEGDVFIHTMLMLDTLDESASLPLVLATLLHDVGKPPMMLIDEDGRIRFPGHAKAGAEMARAILGRLKYPNRVIDDVVLMVGRHMDFMHVRDMRKSTLRRFISSPVFGDELQLHRADCLSSHRKLDHYDFVRDVLESLKEEPDLPAPLVSGDDLISMGWKPGPLFRDMLQWAHNEQMEGRLTSKEQALEEIGRQFGRECGNQNDCLS